MKHMITIPCKKTNDPKEKYGDWVRNESDFDFILCNEATSQWWDIASQKEIEVVLSTHPLPQCYEIKYGYTTTFWGEEPYIRIKNEETGRYKRYHIYEDLMWEIERLVQEAGYAEGVKPTVYLGVNVYE